MCYFTFVTVVINITDTTQECSGRQNPVLSCGYWIREIRGGISSCSTILVEVCLVVCCLCSTECGPFVGGFF